MLSVVPVLASDIERHIGRRPSGYGDFWRLEVSGRFLASSGYVTPHGVPFPEELHNESPIVSNEVWLYADDEGGIVGTYWWPDAVRKPIASVPRASYDADVCVHPDDASSRVDVAVPKPTLEPWQPLVAAVLGPSEVIVFCVTESIPDPLHEMLVYADGGVSVRARSDPERLDVEEFLRSRQPPYRKVRVRLANGAGRDPGRALGPQTWPWPGELRWWEKGVTYEVRGNVPIQTLVEIAESF